MNNGKNEEKNDIDNKDNNIFIPTIILNVLIILISLYLSILYIKSKRLHILACANFLIISFIVFLDNILRIIPLPDNQKGFQFTQALFLVFLDKILLSTIVFQAFITYFGVVKTKFYFRHEKIIFFSGTISHITISIAIAFIFMAISEKLEQYGIYYYCEGTYIKKVIDVVYNSIYLFVNTFCIIILLIYMSTKKEEAEEGIIEDLDYGKHFIKILLMFIVNSLAFIESYLIIYDKLPISDKYIDLVYLTTCLIIDLFYTINKIILKETLKIFCSTIYNKKYPENKKDTDSSNTRSTEIRETEMKEMRKNSFD